MDSPKHKYEFPVAGSAWTHRVELGAGIYFLDGQTHVAGHSSAAERHLLERGAMLIATMRFENEPLDGTRPGHAVRPLSMRESAWRFLGAFARS